jgi:hypothetical protein
MSEPTGIRGSSLTGVAASATIVLDGGVGVVPGGVVMAGAADVYYLAVCRECGEMVFPFDSVARRLVSKSATDEPVPHLYPANRGGRPPILLDLPRMGP